MGESNTSITPYDRFIMFGNGLAKKYFFLPTLIFVIVGGIFLLVHTKVDIHLFINGIHAPWLDTLFSFITYLGEGYVFLMAIPMALFYSKRCGIQIVVTAILVLLLTALFKQVLFDGEPRPVMYFKDLAELRLVPGHKMNQWNSFPSGHTMAAFALFASLAFYTTKRWVAFGLFILAFLVGYSRMYLSQHFLVDVIFGAILGCVAAIAGLRLAGRFSASSLDEPLINH